MAAKPKAKPVAKAPTTDTVPAMLTPKEAVLPVEAVQSLQAKYGPDVIAKLLQGELPGEDAQSEAAEGALPPVVHARRGALNIPGPFSSGFGGQISRPFGGMDFSNSFNNSGASPLDQERASIRDDINNGVNLYQSDVDERLKDVQGDQAEWQANREANDEVTHLACGGMVKPQMLQGGGVVDGHYAVPRGAIPATERALSRLAAPGHYAGGVDAVPDDNLLSRLADPNIQANAASQAAQTRGGAMGQVTPERLANSATASAEQASALRPGMGASRTAYEAANPSLMQQAAKAVPTLAQRMPAAAGASAEQAGAVRSAINANRLAAPPISAAVPQGAMPRAVPTAPGATPAWAGAGGLAALAAPLAEQGFTEALPRVNAAIKGAVPASVLDTAGPGASMGARAGTVLHNAAIGLGEAAKQWAERPVGPSALGGVKQLAGQAGDFGKALFGGSPADAANNALAANPPAAGLAQLGIDQANATEAASKLRDQQAGLTGKPDPQTLDPFNSPANMLARVNGTADAKGFALPPSPAPSARGALQSNDMAAQRLAQGYTPEYMAENNAAKLRDLNSQLGRLPPQGMYASPEERNAWANQQHALTGQLGALQSAMGITPQDRAAELGLQGVKYTADSGLSRAKLETQRQWQQKQADIAWDREKSAAEQNVNTGRINANEPATTSKFKFGQQQQTVQSPWAQGGKPKEGQVIRHQNGQLFIVKNGVPVPYGQ